MMRFLAPLLLVVLGLSACTTTNTPMRMGPDGKPIPVVYRIGPNDAPRVRQRMQDGINTMRAQNGLPTLTSSLELASAGATHAQDMSFQQRPWHWGSDGSSPIQRAQRAGYQGAFVGELISETFETEIETVNAWMIEPETRQVILDPRATELGVGWHQDENGKLWWAVVLGEGQSIMSVVDR
ncbi:MAG: Cysteine-rich secretory protein family [Roseibaca calidilacus]|uniref:Cysteine-rich secretory protein family n=1 Tax=Roseibaca calidilacus TaxID=1666912 RepID=A0A0P7WHZ8_9RHOB|nr:MAG: Cysteine-rich secretory protein family [Roseibaca calidilacus]CUX79414.1 Cysteine-rich secretory protein family protein [Roseibaca calidilacus]